MKISILGTGAYGMALLNVLHYNKYEIRMWTNSDEEADYLNKTRKSPKVDYTIPEDIVISTNMEDIMSGSDIIILAVPSEFVGSVSKRVSKYYSKQYIGIASKGIDGNSLGFLSDVVKNNLNTDLIAVISGCTFASDMVRCVPLGINVASYDSKTLDVISGVLENNYFKVYKTKDVIGTEICGAVKNVMAIGAGMIEGMGYPSSSLAMFITMALNELRSLTLELGGKSDTLLSFAGIGDLLLTSSNSNSRNFTLGKLIGSGSDYQEYISNNTIEGLNTLEVIMGIIKSNNLDMPIITSIYDIIYGEKDCHELMNLWQFILIIVIIVVIVIWVLCTYFFGYFIKVYYSYYNN